MSQTLMIWPILLPLITGALHLFLKGLVPCPFRRRLLQRILNGVSLLLLFGITLVLVDGTMEGARFVYLTGNWLAPFGIVFMLDRLAALFLLLTSGLALLSFIYACQDNTDNLGEHFHPFFALQIFGINGAFLTGDVFNLFVFFEVLLLASYGLLVHGGGKLRTKAGLHFVVINLVGSALFLIAVSTLYGTIGSLNIAHMAVVITDFTNDGIVAIAGMLLLMVFAIKAAMFPLYFWLPQSYPQAQPAVAALFAIMTKVGIYSMIRVHGTIFGDLLPHHTLVGFYAPLLLVMGLATALIAALGALSATHLRVQMAYLVLGSVATILIGVGVNTQASLSASLYYLIHSTITAAGLFLWADCMVRARGNANDSLVASPPTPYGTLIGGIFMLFALSVASMPPLPGFVGKVALLMAVFQSASPPWAITIAMVMVMSGLIVIIALARTGSQWFYRSLPRTTEAVALNTSITLWVVPLVLLGSSLGLTIYADRALRYTTAVASQHKDINGLVEAVRLAVPIPSLQSTSSPAISHKPSLVTQPFPANVPSKEP
jgi:multicomponent K+:H+ antiporter subunit D